MSTNFQPKKKDNDIIFVNKETNKRKPNPLNILAENNKWLLNDNLVKIHTINTSITD